jgi:mannose-6-phosphate isomerase
VVFHAITNTPRDYAWGSVGEIAALLGRATAGGPEAELWLGAHPGSPSRLVGREGETLLGVVPGRLPFLLKVLAAGSPLSLQAHPTMEQAIVGFEREQSAGIPLEAAERNYKDAFHKPELIYALSEQFEALCGFRSAGEVHSAMGDLISRATEAGAAIGPLQRWLDRLDSDDSLRRVFEWLITRGEGVDELVDVVSALADDSTPELATVRVLAEAYPGDPGIAISLMLNRVTLKRGEVLYLPAGNIHAYLKGVGIELMASSDNVLRGGLTSKHVDVPELLSVLDFRPISVPYLEPERPSPGVAVYRPDVPDFVLVTIEDEGSYTITGPAIALCTDGDLEVVGRTAAANLSKGDAVYITPDEGLLEFGGLGTVFLATTG